MTVAVEFASAFSAVPDTVLNPTVLKANSSDENVWCLSVDTITETGFNANLSGPAPAGAKLLWYAQLSAAIIAGADNPTFKRGTEDIETGALSVAVEFVTPFANIPSTIPHPAVVKANPTDANTTVVSIDSLTEAGFNANLSYPAPAGAVLNWSALL
jgi:hypothetical protein